MTDTKVYTTTINDVRYRFNGLILQFDYNGLYKMLDIDLQPQNIKDAFLALRMPDFWVNYFDILEFIKKYKFFGCSLPFITFTLIECFDTLRKQASKQSKHECLLSQLVCIADKKTNSI